MTGIVVTINQSLRERRISKEWVYLKALVEEITASGTNLKTRIRVTLNELIEDGSREAGLDEFYDYFKESAAIWRSGDKARVAQDCKRLIKFYGGAVASPVKTFAAAPASTAPSQLPAKGDGLDSNSPKEKTCPETSGTVRPSSQSMAQKAVKRLRLTEEERRFVREPIWTGAFRRQALELDKCLKQLEGVSQEDIMDWQSGCEPARVELDLFNTQCDMVALRLTELFEEKSQENERSPQPPMMVTNVLGVRTGQD